jgi:TrmH family RNA methyltransferase
LRAPRRKIGLLPPATQLEHLRVVLVATRNPLNLGAAARAMSNFGVLRLRVVNPFELAFREARSAVGPASEILADAEQFNTLAHAIADCGLVVGTTAIQGRDLQHPIRQLDEGAGLIREQLASTPVAIVFGSEKTGLSNDDVSYCHWLTHIPTRTGHLSMNLGQAVAVTLYEIVRGPQTRAFPAAITPATAAELERITTVLLDALSFSGYVTAGAITATEEKARRLVRRMNLNSRDAEVLLGILRQISWKLEQVNSPKP